MGIFLTLLLFFVLFYLSLRQIFKNLYGLEPVEENERWASSILLVGSISILFCLCISDALPFCLALELAALYPLTSSVIPVSWSKTAAVMSTSLQAVCSVAIFVANHMLHVPIPSFLLHYMPVAVCCVVAVMFLYSIYSRLIDIKLVMRSGSVWTMVCLSVDAVYMVMILLSAVMTACGSAFMVSLLMATEVVALGIRIRKSSVFVVLVNLERRIVESMKVSQVDFVGETPGTDQLYKNIYERLLRYFDLHKPYLNNELTINDIVEVVFTNKLYISKAINHCTGRNFCQFVNYYRVTHAVALFREDPQLKVIELTSRSGFNSTTSFSAAFKLYMGEKPGDWCRKERVRLSKK